MYKNFNPNPCGKKVGDCVIRGISILTDKSWNDVYMGLCLEGLKMCDMPSSNVVWHNYLLEHSFTQKTIQPTTVKEFCKDNPKGKYLLATGTHVVTIIDGNYYDAWDSGNETIIYFYVKEKE